MFEFLPGFDTIRDSLANNQFLVGGIGTVVAGSVAYALRAIPSSLYNLIQRWGTSSLQLNSRSLCYTNVQRCLHKHRLNVLNRNYGVIRDESELSAGFGTSWARYKGIFILCNRSTMKNNFNSEEELTLKFFTRQVRFIQEFLDEANSLKDKDTVQIYVSSGNHYSIIAPRHKRSMDTVFINDDKKEKLIETVTRFKEREDWYISRGIPYKLCICLYGPPGTGKTSLILALASHFNLDIRYIKTLFRVEDLVSDLGPKDLVVIEDIDSMSLASRDEEDEAGYQAIAGLGENMTGSKPKKKQPEGFGARDNLQALLNTFDGFYTPHGFKAIITSNYIEQLDPALLRPGRIDLKLEIGPADQTTTRSMFQAFYAPEEHALIEPYLTSSEFRPQVGAALQGIFGSSTAEQAVKQLSEGKTNG